jgi:hypothetical protein
LRLIQPVCAAQRNEGLDMAINIIACIKALADRGEMAPEDAAYYEAFVRGHARARQQELFEASETGAPQPDPVQPRFDRSEQAVLWANHRLLDLIEAQGRERQRHAKLQAAALGKVDAHLTEFVNRTGEPDIGEAALALIEHQGWHRGRALNSSLQGRFKAILSRAVRDLDASFEKFIPVITGTDIKGWYGKLTGAKANPDNIVRELAGVNTGDQAAEAVAKSWADVAEGLRQRFNEAGGNIGKLEGWIAPQRHDVKAVAKLGREAWIAKVKGLVDWSRMRDPLTGLLIPAELHDEALGSVFDAILTDGWSRREVDPRAGVPMAGKKLARTRAEHRFLLFKDAESWMAYQKELGEGDIIASMMDHVRGMARDIAALELFGPNPETTVDYVKAKLQKELANVQIGRAARIPRMGAKGATDWISTKTARFHSMWHKFKGETLLPANAILAEGFDTIRNIKTSSALGSTAILAAGTDPMLGALARQFVGVPGWKVFQGYLAQLNPANPAHREAARDAGVILEHWVNVLGDQSRWEGEMGTSRWSAAVADNVLKMTGLNALTQAGRSSFQLDVMVQIASEAKRDWKGLQKRNPAMQRFLERYGFTEQDWQLLRSVAPRRSHGAPAIIHPRDVDALGPGGRRVADLLAEAIIQESELATPMGTVRAQSLLGAHLLQPGTIGRTVMGSIGHLKTFSISIIMTHGYRLYELAWRNPAHAAAHATALITLTTLGAAMAMQLQEIVKGRDPRNMVNDEFWRTAILKGGGLGFYGDFMVAGQNEYGNTFADSQAGPIWSAVGQFLALTVGNLNELTTDQETQAGRELTRFLKDNMPGSTLWYARLALDRYIWDTLQLAIDPEAEDAFRRREAFYKREFDQRFYWAPGELAPERSPDTGEAIR